MNLRIIINNNEVKRVYLAPSTKDLVQVLYIDEFLKSSKGWIDFPELLIKKEINIQNPLEFEDHITDSEE